MIWCVSSDKIILMLGGDLNECNRQMLLQHRRNLIEQAYRASKQQDYRMPRENT